MAESNAQNLLAKSHSISQHLGKMKKAVSSFHDSMVQAHNDHAEKCEKMHKAAAEDGNLVSPDFHTKMVKLHKDHAARMTKLHKAHHDDMHKAIGHLHKLVGVDPAPDAEGSYANHGVSSNEPQPRDLMGSGTVNLQDFGGTPSDDAAKTVKPQTQSAPAPATSESVTKTELADMLKGLLEQFETKLESQQVEFAKALFSPEDGVQLESMPNAPQMTQTNYQPVHKANGVGVGDRTRLAQPVAQVVTDANLSKGHDNGTQTQQVQPVKLTPDMAKAAIEGSDDEKIQFMRTVRPQEVPATLIAPLSKIHS